jgi:hypothetical protein
MSVGKPSMEDPYDAFDLTEEQRRWLEKSRDPLYYGEQDENGVDLSLIREQLKLTPSQRLRELDRARRGALRLMEYGRRHRQKST